MLCIFVRLESQCHCPHVREMQKHESSFINLPVFQGVPFYPLLPSASWPLRDKQQPIPSWTQLDRGVAKATPSPLRLPSAAALPRPMQQQLMPYSGSCLPSTPLGAASVMQPLGAHRCCGWLSTTVCGVWSHRNSAKPTRLIYGLLTWGLLWVIPADAGRVLHWGQSHSSCSTRTEISVRQENKSTS